MKLKTALITLPLMILGASTAAFAEPVVLQSLPSPELLAFVSGKTFDAHLNGYGWGEEDDPSSLSLDLVIMEPLTFDAAEVESLAAGDTIIAGIETYTVVSAEKEGETIVVTPEEEWLTPITFTPNDDGTYFVENEEGVIKGDTLSFPGYLDSELKYVNQQGEELTAAELLGDLVDESFDTTFSVAKVVIDETGHIVELNYSGE